MIVALMASYLSIWRDTPTGIVLSSIAPLPFNLRGCFHRSDILHIPLFRFLSLISSWRALIYYDFSPLCDLL